MPRVTAEHREQRREQIILAAMACVAREGFHKTTMADVIAASGLSAGAVYGYFRSKEELILAIVDYVLSHLDQALGELLSLEPVPSPIEVTRQLTTRIVEHAEAAPVDITKVVVAAWAEAVRHEQVRAEVGGRIRRLRDRYVVMIRNQQQAGMIDATADAEQVAKSLFGVMPGFILQRLVTQDVTPQEYAEGYAALLQAVARPGPGTD